MRAGQSIGWSLDDAQRRVTGHPLAPQSAMSIRAPRGGKALGVPARRSGFGQLSWWIRIARPRVPCGLIQLRPRLPHDLREAFVRARSGRARGRAAIARRVRRSAMIARHVMPQLA